MNVILLNKRRSEAKGYHEYPFTVRTGESFVLEKKIADRGKAFLP